MKTPGKEIVLAGFGVGLSRESRRLKVRHQKKVVYEIPTDQVDGVYVLTSAASVTAEAVRAVSENGASLSFFNRRGEPYALLVHPDTFSDADLRAKQIDAARSQQGLHIAKSIIHGKIANQAATLRYFAKSRKKTRPELFRNLRENADKIEKLNLLLKEIRGDSGHAVRSKIMALEAEAAARYWAQFKHLLPEELEFHSRYRRGASDPVNSSLNYGYGILYAKVFAKITRSGLDPYVGFLHAWRNGRAALLFDFVEVFRQYFVDRPVLGWMLKQGRPQVECGRLTRETRERLAQIVLDRLNRKVNYKGAIIAAEEVIQVKARELSEEIRGGPTYESYIWPW